MIHFMSGLNFLAMSLVNFKEFVAFVKSLKDKFRIKVQFSSNIEIESNLIKKRSLITENSYTLLKW